MIEVNKFQCAIADTHKREIASAKSGQQQNQLAWFSSVWHSRWACQASTRCGSQGIFLEEKQVIESSEIGADIKCDSMIKEVGKPTDSLKSSTNNVPLWKALWWRQAQAGRPPCVIHTWMVSRKYCETIARTKDAKRSGDLTEITKAEISPWIASSMPAICWTFLKANANSSFCRGPQSQICKKKLFLLV